MPFVRNAWYVAALPEEIEGEALARMVLEVPLVLFRQADATPAALLDICLHRFAALSDGALRDGIL